jgi:hypothetical protein
MEFGRFGIQLKANAGIGKRITAENNPNPFGFDCKGNKPSSYLNRMVQITMAKPNPVW